MITPALKPTLGGGIAALGTAIFILLSLLLLPSVGLAAAETAGSAKNNAKYAILIDYKTGAVLYGKGADVPMAPSSMTKIMTAYVAFQALDKGEIALDDVVKVSPQAFKMGGSRTFLALGSEVRIEDLLKGVIIQSGNDASVALAEAISGSEGIFVSQMNQVAQQLGMTGTSFYNSSGWPDPQHKSTAMDLARLARAMIRDFPQYYPYHAEKSFTYNSITQPNRNTLLTLSGVDGIKTGHTDEGGFGMVVSALRKGGRLIAVVNGLPTAAARHVAAAELLDYGSIAYKAVRAYGPEDEVARVRVRYGVSPNVPLVAGEEVVVMVPRASAMRVNPLTTPTQKKGLKNGSGGESENLVQQPDASARIASPSSPKEHSQAGNVAVTTPAAPTLKAHVKQDVHAPVQRGQELGYLILSQHNIDGNEVRIPLYAGETVEAAGFLERLVQNLFLVVERAFASQQSQADSSAKS